MRYFYDYNGGYEEYWDGEEWVTITETTPLPEDAGNTIALEDGLEVNAPDGKIFLYWYLTIGSNGQIEPLPAELDSNYIHQSLEEYTFPSGWTVVDA